MTQTSTDLSHSSLLPSLTSNSNVEPRVQKFEVAIEDKNGVLHKSQLRAGSGLVAMRAKGTPIEFDCLKADCGICIVSVVNGSESLSQPTAAEAEFLKAMRAEPNERLACQCRVGGDVHLKIEF
jgi:ferredoxin